MAETAEAKIEVPPAIDPVEAIIRRSEDMANVAPTPLPGSSPRSTGGRHGDADDEVAEVEAGVQPRSEEEVEPTEPAEEVEEEPETEDEEGVGEEPEDDEEAEPEELAESKPAQKPGEGISQDQYEALVTSLNTALGAQFQQEAPPTEPAEKDVAGEAGEPQEDEPTPELFSMPDAQLDDEFFDALGFTDPADAQTRTLVAKHFNAVAKHHALNAMRIRNSTENARIASIVNDRMASMWLAKELYDTYPELNRPDRHAIAAYAMAEAVKQNKDNKDITMKALVEAAKTEYDKQVGIVDRMIKEKARVKSGKTTDARGRKGKTGAGPGTKGRQRRGARQEEPKKGPTQQAMEEIRDAEGDPIYRRRDEPLAHLRFGARR